MPLIGTAGHVDHGKSTLIQRITGRDPDRWEEEKRRGLTIDLGFAWATLPDGTEVSFVDVPGHERYLKNMLAGIEAIDAALFVVAADEGWMPQSEEHLAVLDLLGVEHGVAAITKSDAVDGDLLELARAEVAEKLGGTSLARAPILTVSGTTGEGVDSLLVALSEQLPEAEPPDGRPRLWVDRSFTIPGAGTVVTGSLLGSALSVGDNVDVLPDGPRARIRGLQSHERSLESVQPGRRVAVNLAGVDHDAIDRGDMIGMAGQWDTTTRFAVSLRTARFVDGIDQRGAYQLHIGSSAHPVELVALGEGAAVMQVAHGLPLTVGDRFIVRDTGRQLVVGGGWVVDPAPGRSRRALQAVAGVESAEDPDRVATRLLAGRRLDRLSRLTAHSGGGRPQGAVIIGDLAVESGKMDELESAAVSLVEAEHRRHPLRPGLPMATLAARLRIDAELVEALVERAKRLDRRGPDVALADHQPVLSAKQEAAWVEARERLLPSLAVPGPDELGVDPDVIHLKIRMGELIRISDDLLYLPSQIEDLLSHMSELGEDFTVAEFRDAAGLSRKYAVPILEWADKEGLTFRRGDTRSLR